MIRIKRTLKTILSLCLAVVMVFLILPIQTQAGSTVKLNKTSTTIYVGQTTTLKVSGTSKTVKWSTSDKKIATVSSKGKVTAKKKGTATITAKVGKKSYKCKVTVKEPYINATKKSLVVGETYTLKLTGATAKKYTSSNKSIATVSSKGKITAKKAGKATITVTDSNKKTYKCTVTVTITENSNSDTSDTCPHTWKAATCTEPQTCTKCGETEGVATGHDWTTATCSQKSTCINCGETKGEKAAHNFEWVTTREAAVGVAGLKEHKCITCGYVDGTETIPALADVGQETPWVYADSTHRTKTMYDGTVICEELVTCGYYSVWGYYDDGAASAMNDAVNYMLVNVNGWNPFNVSSAYYDNARRNAVAYAIKGGSDKAYHFNRGGLPDINNDRQYITLSDGNNQDNYIGCFVRDTYQGNGDNTYGEYWCSHFGTYYASGSF